MLGEHLNLTELLVAKIVKRKIGLKEAQLELDKIVTKPRTHPLWVLVRRPLKQIWGWEREGNQCFYLMSAGGLCAVFCRNSMLVFWRRLDWYAFPIISLSKISTRCSTIHGVVNMFACAKIHKEFFLAMVLGVIGGMITESASYFEPLAMFSDAISAIVSGAVIRLFIEYVHPACYISATTGSLIWLIPGTINIMVIMISDYNVIYYYWLHSLSTGMSFTLGLSEIICRRTVAGIAKLCNALIGILQLGIGMALGMPSSFDLYSICVSCKYECQRIITTGPSLIFWTDAERYSEISAQTVCSPVDDNIFLAMFLATSIGYNILNECHWKQVKG